MVSIIPLHAESTYIPYSSDNRVSHNDSDLLLVAPVSIVTQISTEDLISDPRLYKIFKCESGLRQFDSSGNPLMSPTHDVGISQINQTHWDEAKKLGLDIFNSTEDNIKMAKIILQQQGYSAWTCSRLI